MQNRRKAFQPSGTTPYNPLSENFATALWIVDNAIVNGASVTNVPDSGVNGWNLTNEAATALPLISNNWLNGHSIMSFDASNDKLAAGNVSMAQPYSVSMVVFNKPAVNGGGVSTTTDETTLVYWSGTNFQVKATTEQAFGNAADYTNFWHVLTIIMNGSSTRTMTNLGSWQIQT